MATAIAHRNDLLRSVVIQGRVLGALVMREIITRYGRHNIGFMWVFVEPMMFTAGVMAVGHSCIWKRHAWRWFHLS